MLEQFKKELMEWFAKDDLSKVLQLLFERVNEEADRYMDVCANKPRLATLEREYHNGLLDPPEYTKQRNMVRLAVLDTIQNLAEQDLKNVKTALTEAIEALQLGPLPKIALVNLDRSQPFMAFQSGFEATCNLPYQFYFILGDPDQQPHHFAERAVYEIVAQVLINDEKAIHYKREQFTIGGTPIDRVCVEPLPFSGFGLESCKNLLKAKLQERTAHLQLGFEDIESFAALPEARLPYRYFTLVFSIDFDGQMGGVWHRHLTPYLEWLVHTFRANRKSQPTFQFIFVLSKQNTDRSTDPAVDQALNDLIARFNPQPGDSAPQPNPCVRIDGLWPVKTEDIKAWLIGLSKQRLQFQIDNIMVEYGKKLQQQHRWDGTSDLDMAQLEELILEIYHRSRL